MSSSDHLNSPVTSTCIRRKMTPSSEHLAGEHLPNRMQDNPDSLSPPADFQPPQNHQDEDQSSAPKPNSSDPCLESKPSEAPADTCLKPSDDDEPLCRICFAGRDDEDTSLGRFIQPCLCRGSMAYIHVGCLQKWRRMSSLRSFYQCDQCGYRYKLRRAKVAGLAENKIVLGCVTMFVFFLLVTLAGFAADWLLEGQAVSEMAAADGWSYSFGSLSYDSTGKFVGEAVGEAVRVLNSKLPLNLDQPARAKPANYKKSEEAILESISDSQDTPNTYRYVNAKRRSGATGREQNSEFPATASSRMPNSANVETSSHRAPSSLGQSLRERLNSLIENLTVSVVVRLKRFAKHSILGLSFIGIIGFFQLVMSLTFISPFNFGMRHSVLRMIRTNNGRPGGRDASGPGSFLILLYLILGLALAIRSVWRFVRRCSQWALRKVEDSVLDVT